MDLLTALKILIRRWPVVLAGLVLTVFAVVQVGTIVKPTYEAKATVLFKSPGAANPFLEFPAGLEVTADALIVVLQSPVGGKQLEAAGATADYSLERTNGPIVEITADGATSDSADGTVDLVVQALKDELKNYQATAPADQMITVDAITEPTSQAKYGSRIRAQFAVAAIGLAATVAAGLAVDALMRQRQESKLRRQALAEAEAERDDDWYPPSHGGGHAARPMADEPRRAVAPNGTRSGAPTVPVLNGGTVNGRSSVYRPKPSRSRSEVPADGPPQPTAASVTAPGAPQPSPAPVGAPGAPQPKAAPGGAPGAPQGGTAPPGPPAGTRRPGERSLTDRLAVDLSSAGRPAPDGLAERPPLARRPAGPPPGPQPSRPAGDARPPTSPPPAGPQPSRPAPVGDARPPAGAPAGDSRQPQGQDGKAAEAPRANLP